MKSFKEVNIRDSAEESKEAAEESKEAAEESKEAAEESKEAAEEYKKFEAHIQEASKEKRRKRRG